MSNFKFQAASVVTFLLWWVTPSQAQISGYTSFGYGYHQNPLANYARIPDQIKQGYVSLSYDTEGDYSAFGLQYVGGLMAFNSFADRTFYEHRLAGTYSIRFEADSPDSTESDEESDDSTAVKSKPPEEASARDSIDQYLSVTLAIAARHDKPLYLEFDNRGAELSATYRGTLGQSMYGRLTNQLAVRQYLSVTALSNTNDLLSGEMGWLFQNGMTFGFTGSAGVKYYTNSAYDTTQYETSRSFTVNPAGKGKPGGKQLSSKTILVQPKANGTVQIDGALFFRKDWSSQSTLLASILYRRDVRSAVRYLAQKTGASTMTEDIYNDFFSYEGPEVRLRVAQPLPGGVQLVLEGELQSKRFAAPALTLGGEDKGENRKDVRSTFDLYASRFVQVWNDFGFDISVSASLARNQSNDSYNDYSFQAVSFGLGFSF